MSSPVVAGTGSAVGKAIIIRPLSFFAVQDMNLGDIIPGTGGGTVRLYPNGTRTSTGTIVLSGNAHQPARFVGLGAPNQQVSMTVPAATVYLTGPGAPMPLNNFEVGSSPTVILSGTPNYFRITSAIGNFNFPVGGTLTVAGNQTPGNYSGTFSITLNYL